jgi:hypothetical protein
VDLFMFSKGTIIKEAFPVLITHIEYFYAGPCIFLTVTGRSEGFPI